MADVADVFLQASRRYLGREYLPKLEACLALLSDADVWWRPNDASNSIGNLLLHLEGNVRQWILHGVAGAPDVRQRQQEFDERRPQSREALLAALKKTLAEVDDVLGHLDADALLERRTIQGFSLTVQEAVYHVVEHFSTHVGQILYIAKLRTGRDLALYEVDGPNVRPRWAVPEDG